MATGVFLKSRQINIMHFSFLSKRHNFSSIYFEVWYTLFQIFVPLPSFYMLLYSWFQLSKPFSNFLQKYSTNKAVHHYFPITTTRRVLKLHNVALSSCRGKGWNFSVKITRHRLTTNKYGVNNGGQSDFSEN